MWTVIVKAGHSELNDLRKPEIWSSSKQTWMKRGKTSGFCTVLLLLAAPTWLWGRLGRHILLQPVLSRTSSFVCLITHLLCHCLFKTRALYIQTYSSLVTIASTLAMTTYFFDQISNQELVVFVFVFFMRRHKYYH